MATRYVFLMRHVAGYKSHHSGVGEEERSAEHPALLLSGVRAACSVAYRLHETIQQLPPDRQVSLGETWHAPGSEPTATANIVADRAGLEGPPVDRRLGPSRFFPGGGPEAAAALTSLVDAINRHHSTTTANALLIIGHEPQMGWLAHRLTNRDVPVDRGELLCLARSADDRHWRLRWTIHPDDRVAAAVIQEKIKSKMDAAKVMGAFITALVTFVLGQFLAHPNVVGGAWILRVVTIALLLAAASLFFVALFLYDSLLMPSRFWGAGVPRERERRLPGRLVDRPPSSAAWVLYQNMVRIWNRTFVPAVYAVGLALITFCQALLKPDRLIEYWVIPSGLVGALLVVAWAKLNRPQLGAQD
jgi:hypothetical protein